MARGNSAVPAVRRSRGAGRSGGVAQARLPLTRQRILSAAQALIERDGLAAFSIRGLGAALACEPMSVYHYFSCKARLLDAVVDDALNGISTDPPGDDPIEQLRAMAHSYLALARRQPKLFPLLAVHRLNTGIGVRLIESALSLVHAAVPDDRLAAQYFRVLCYYLTGAALDETQGYAGGLSAAEPVTDAYIAAHCPRLAAAARYHRRDWWSSTFELGLEHLLDAIRQAARTLAVAETVTVPAPKPVIRPKH
jgi:AcrR family transcriptional regulator